MTKKTGKFRKTFFPVGIFLMLFIIQSAAAGLAVSVYFIYSGKKRIDDIIKYTKNYSITMAEGFADFAQLSYRSKKYSELKELFQEKLRDNTVDEAFFVLTNGKIVVHSNKDAVKNLEGNIANDEFAYNLDLILKPVKDKSREVVFQNYNYIGKTIPFDRETRMLLKKYLYEDIDKTGWLVTRAVFIKKKPVGAVSFIIGKERIFNVISALMAQCLDLLYWAVAGAAFVSLFVSMAVFVRYRMIQNKTLSYARGYYSDLLGFAGEGESVIELGDITGELKTVNGGSLIELRELSLDEAVKKSDSSDYITIELLAEIDDDKAVLPGGTAQGGVHRRPVVGAEEPIPVILGKEIKDAIPVAKKS